MSSFHASAARTPCTLLAAICSPLPEPPITTPRLPGSLTTAPRPPQHERRVVVDRVVLDGSVVDDLVAELTETLGQVGLELEAGVVGAEMHAHGGQSGRTAGVTGVLGVDGCRGGWVGALVDARPA